MRWVYWSQISSKECYVKAITIGNKYKSLDTRERKEVKRCREEVVEVSPGRPRNSEEKGNIVIVEELPRFHISGACRKSLEH